MIEALTPTPLAQPLDDYLRQVVQTLHEAVSQAMRHRGESPAAAAQPIADCREILSTIMAGDVHTWLGD